MTTFRKKSLNKISQKPFLVAKSASKNKNSQKFDYHLRLPFKIAQIELKYVWTFLGFISISLALLLVLQNLTTYSSNNLAPQKPRTVRLITNFGQKINQNQSNLVQEFQTASLSNQNQAQKETKVTTKNQKITDLESE